MVQVQAKLSSKNQISLPAKVRKALGVHALERVNFIIDGDKVTVEPVRLTLDDIFQSIPPLKRDGIEVVDLEYEEAMDMDPEAAARIDTRVYDQ